MQSELLMRPTRKGRRGADQVIDAPQPSTCQRTTPR